MSDMDHLAGVSGVAAGAHLANVAPAVSQACVDAATGVDDVSGTAVAVGAGDMFGSKPIYSCPKCGRNFKTKEDLAFHSESCVTARYGI